MAARREASSVRRVLALEGSALISGRLERVGLQPRGAAEGHRRGPPRGELPVPGQARRRRRRDVHGSADVRLPGGLAPIGGGLNARFASGPVTTSHRDARRDRVRGAHVGGGEGGAAGRLDLHRLGLHRTRWTSHGRDGTALAPVPSQLREHLAGRAGWQRPSSTRSGSCVSERRTTGPRCGTSSARRVFPSQSPRVGGGEEPSGC